MSTIRTANLGPLTGNTATVVDPATPAGGSATFGPLVSFAAVSASGTSVTFNGIPSWARRITVMVRSVSTNGSADWLVRLGTSGGITTSGYLGSSSLVSSGVNTVTYTAGFGVNWAGAGASMVGHGTMIISLVDPSTNVWAESGTFSQSDSARSCYSSGSVALSGVVTQVQLTTSNGSDAFDAGSVNVMYE